MSKKISNYLDNYFYQIKSFVDLTVILNKEKGSGSVLFTLMESFTLQRVGKKAHDILPNYDYMLLDLFITEGPVETIIHALNKLRNNVQKGDHYTVKDVERIIEICRENFTNKYIYNYLIRRMAIKLNTDRIMGLDDERFDLMFNCTCIFDHDFNYFKAWLFNKYTIEKIKQDVMQKFDEMKT